MGLDMYLRSLPRIEGMGLDEILLASARLRKHEEENSEIYNKIKNHIKDFEEFDMSWRSMFTELAYWRKANQIHHWFVESVQDGKDDMSHYEVNRDHLLELHDRCLEVLDRKTPADDVLPTRPGPFFGDTGYDQYYFHEINRTRSILTNILETFNFDTHYILYHANW
ncbi:MAG TPA: hypothetical protein DCR24_14065 [Bacillus bacterium]|nr:hypothetical protein [Bacillus sp. (in: firmicutes)]